MKWYIIGNLKGIILFLVFELLRSYLTVLLNCYASLVTLSISHSLVKRTYDASWLTSVSVSSQTKCLFSRTTKICFKVCILIVFTFDKSFLNYSSVQTLFLFIKFSLIIRRVWSLTYVVICLRNIEI